MVGKIGEGTGEAPEGVDGLVNHLQRWSGVAIDTAFCKEGHGQECLACRSFVLVKGGKFVTRLYHIVI